MTGNVIGQYRILEKLGEGGMGSVYKAEDLHLRRMAALKFLHASGDRERLLREAQAAGALNHPNVCTVYQVDPEAGFIAMEFVEGRTLHDLIGGRPLPAGEALAILAQAAEGLAAAHRLGIVHRDIKPANLMVGPTGTVKIMDFGLAGEAARPGASQLGGTPGYLAPERMQGRAATSRSDIWALGAVLHEALTGRPPAGELGVLPEGVGRIVRKALAADPEQRYQHAEDLAVDLRRAGGPTGALRRRAWIAGAACVAAGAGFGAWRFASNRDSGIRSVAVLPLENLSRDPEQDYFVDGLHDEITALLSRIGGLTVVSRTSTARYRGSSKPAEQIGRELSVAGLLSGSVRRSGTEIAITLRLTRASSGEQIWAETYRRGVRDVLALQAEIATAAAKAIGVALGPAERVSVSASRQIDSKAYEAFLRGNHFLHQGISGLRRSEEWFGRAIAIDARHADAHAGLALCLVYQAIFELRPTAEAYLEARKAAVRALDIDPGNAGAHAAFADIKKGFEWDFSGAIQEHRRSLELSPNHLIARLWFAETLSRLERHDEALVESSQALRRDPVSALSHNSRSMLLWRARRYREAIASAETALELDSNQVNALWWLGVSYVGAGDVDRAIATLTKAVSAAPIPLLLACLAYVYGRAGKRDKALETERQLESIGLQRFVSPAGFAIVRAGLGDAEGVFRWLRKAYESRDFRVQQLTWPLFDPFRADPRYAELKRLGGLTGA